MGKRTTRINHNLILLKLGGSLITHKYKKEKINRRGISSVATALLGLQRHEHTRRRIVLVHGGGSFGHYWAKKYHLSEKPKIVDPAGITRTRLSMLQLHSYILKILAEHSIACETIQASELFTRNLDELTSQGLAHVQNCFLSGLVPITFGDVLIQGRKAFILSGDRICQTLAKSLRPSKVIFAMDVDGIFDSFNRKEGRVLPQVGESSRASVSGNSEFDVTGGLKAKITAGLRIAKHGSDVFYVNGFRSDRIEGLILGRNEISTRIPHS
jgi:isopentenyl phosphate kinase